MNMIDTLAYLDPGAGSMMIQALVAGSAGAMVFFRHVYRSWKYGRKAQAPAAVAKVSWKPRRRQA